MGVWLTVSDKNEITQKNGNFFKILILANEVRKIQQLYIGIYNSNWFVFSNLSHLISLWNLLETENKRYDDKNKLSC